MRNKRYIFCTLYVVFCILCAQAQTQVLTLDSCLSSARQRNCTIQVSQLEVRVSQEVKKQMLWKYFPQVSLSGFAYRSIRPIIDIDLSSGNIQGGFGDFVTQVMDLLKESAEHQDEQLQTDVKMMRWGVSAQASAVQPLYWGGQIVTANKLAKLGIEASELKGEVSERDVQQEVTETYWLVAGLLEKRATVKKATELLDSITDVAQTAYNCGLATRNDLLRVQLKQNEVQTKTMQLEDGIQLASRLLCHMAGLPYTGELLLESFPEYEEITELAPKPSEIVIDGRPEAKLLELNVRYNQLMRRLTLGESLPHLALGLSGGYINFFEEHKFNGLAFLSLTIPITGWGETSHKLKEHDLRIRQAELMQQNYREKLDLQNRQTYDQLIESIKLMEQHRASHELAKENYRIAMMNYKAGVGTMTELLESEALLLQAENAYTDARISYRAALRKFQEYNK